MNKGSPLAVFIQCLNSCFNQESCFNCKAYSSDFKTCYYSNPNHLFHEYKESALIYVYSTEHAKIGCQKCTLTKKNFHDSTCIFNHIKVLCKLKCPEKAK